MPYAPLPSSASSLDSLAEALDALDHPGRLAWAYALDDREQLALYALAADNAPLRAADLVGDDEQVVIHPGRNGLALFNRFEKRFARLGDEIVGYNHNENIAGPLSFLVRRLIGPGHFLAYDGPDDDGVWIDYRRLPSRRHPAFPPLIDNDHGVRGLVFGNMVDILRRVSQHVLIGNAYKDKSAPTTLASRIGSRLPTAPFVLVQPPR